LQSVPVDGGVSISIGFVFCVDIDRHTPKRIQQFSCTKHPPPMIRAQYAEHPGAEASCHFVCASSRLEVHFRTPRFPLDTKCITPPDEATKTCFIKVMDVKAIMPRNYRPRILSDRPLIKSAPTCRGSVSFNVHVSQEPALFRPFATSTFVSCFET
jgi:hypothetical protein